MTDDTAAEPLSAEEEGRLRRGMKYGAPEVAHHFIDRLLATLDRVRVEAVAEGAGLERQRIYMALVDRLWGCDSDANGVLDIVENPDD